MERRIGLSTLSINENQMLYIDSKNDKLLSPGPVLYRKIYGIISSSDRTNRIMKLNFSLMEVKLLILKSVIH